MPRNGATPPALGEGIREKRRIIPFLLVLRLLHALGVYVWIARDLLGQRGVDRNSI
jgi:hypothetical protein